MISGQKDRQTDGQIDVGASTRTFLDQDDTSKPSGLEVPEVDRGDSTLKVKFPVGIKRSVGRDLELPEVLGRDSSVFKRWVVLV
jgi:hypothetical protein